MASIQTSIWREIFGSFSSPDLWFPILVYFSFYRPLKEAYLICFLNSLVLYQFTLVPWGVLFLTSIAVVFLLTKFKKRIFWPGPTYFVITTALGLLLFYLFYFFISLFLDKSGTPSFLFLDWFLKILLTSLFSPLLYLMYSLLDQLSGREKSNPMEDMV